jgi:hypothetical protein
LLGAHLGIDLELVFASLAIINTFIQFEICFIFLNLLIYLLNSIQAVARIFKNSVVIVLRDLVLKRNKVVVAFSRSSVRELKHVLMSANFLIVFLINFTKDSFNLGHSVLIPRCQLLFFKPEFFVLVSLHVNAVHRIFKLRNSVFHFEFVMKMFGFIAVGSIVVLAAQLLVLVRLVQNLLKVILKIVRYALNVFTVSLLVCQHGLLKLLKQLVHF